MQTPPCNIADADKRLPGHLPLEGRIPRPSFRVFEVFALCGDNQRSLTGAGSRSEVIDDAVGQACVRLERWVAAKENGITDAEPSDKAANSGANNRLASCVERICDAHSGLKIVPLNI